MANSVQPHRRQPTRLCRPWDSPGKNAGMGCHFLLQCMKVKLLSHVQLLVTPWTVAYQAPPSMGFSRQKYWSGLPLPSPKLPHSLTKIFVFVVNANIAFIKIMSFFKFYVLIQYITQAPHNICKS